MRLVLFDVDGTLQDSQAHIYAATAEAFRAKGLSIPARAEVRGGVGLSVEHAMLRLVPDLSPSDLEELGYLYRGAFFDLVTSGSADAQSPLFEGALEVLRTLQAEEDVILGVATGKSRRGVERMLTEHNLGGVFQTFQVADGHPSKPHPSMILTAMAETGATPEQTVMVGDTTYDVLMAKAAGVVSIGVDWGYHLGSDLLEAGAQSVVTSFDQLPEVLRDVNRG